MKMDLANISYDDLLRDGNQIQPFIKEDRFEHANNLLEQSVEIISPIGPIKNTEISINQSNRDVS